MTTKKCTEKRDTRANLLLCLINLFSAVLTISRLSPSLKLPSVQTRVLVHKRHIWSLRASESIQFWVLWKNILPLKLRHNDRWYIAENCLFTTIFYIKSVLCSDFNFPVTHFVFDTCDETFSFFLTENCLAESCFLLYDFPSFLRDIFYFRQDILSDIFRYIIMEYINTNEMPGELSRENMLSSHVKISPLLWLHNKTRLSHQKAIKVKWFGSSLVFI